ncbi:MAG: hypothetical protein ACOC85_05255, partial [Thermoplasmatota archaeon]
MSIPDELYNVIVAGKSGAGKQPRIDVLVEEFCLEQLSTGDIFRNYLKKFDDFGYDDDLSKFWNEKEKKFISDDEIENILETDDKSVIFGLKAKYFVDRGLY